MASFDTIDHDLLMLHLECQFGLHSSGFIPVCVTGPLVLFLEVTLHLWFTCFA